MAKEFWGIEVKPGETVTSDPRDRILHLSQASLGETKKGSENTLIFLKVNDQKLVLGTLAADKCAQIAYDLFFEKEFELSHSSRNTSVYFFGYKASLDENDSEYSGLDVTCKFCSRVFNSEKALESHIKAKHPMKRITTDLHSEILLRLPTASIIRFRIACKIWQSETLRPEFIEDHLNLALQVDRPPCFIFHRRSQLTLIRSNGFQINFPIPRRIKIYGSRNGILCASDSRRIFLYNPLTSQQFFMPVFSNMVDISEVFFGFHPVTKEYKVIAFTRESLSRQVSGCYICTVGSQLSSWTKVQCVSGINPVGNCDAAELNGAIYFISEAIERTVFSIDLRDHSMTEFSLYTVLEETDEYHILNMCLSELNGRIYLSLRDRLLWFMYELQGEDWHIRRVIPADAAGDRARDVHLWKPLSIYRNRLYCSASHRHCTFNEMLCDVGMHTINTHIIRNFGREYSFVCKHVETLATLPMMDRVPPGAGEEL